MEMQSTDATSLSLNHLSDLFTYQEWADSQFFKRWKDFEKAHDDQQILKLTDHFVKVQTFFLHILQSRDPDRSKWEAPLRLFPELITTARDNHAQLRKVVSSLKTEDLSPSIQVPFFPGEFRPTIHEILMQIVMHTQHHRAQVLQQLATYTKKSIIIDWISWVFHGKPHAAWD